MRQCRANKSDRKYLLTGFSTCPKCGAPLVGAALMKGRYRYYRCRATVPIASRPATCDARYIPADEFEDVAWRTLAAAVRSPAVLVSELRDHFATGGGDLGKEMASLRREILDLKGQQKRLLKLYRKDFVDQDLLAGENGPLMALTEEKERALRVLEDQQRYKDDVSKVEGRIFDACREIAKKLDTLDFEGKRATLAAFGVKVQATREDMSMTVVVDPKVTTIVQTSA